MAIHARQLTLEACICAWLILVTSNVLALQNAPPQHLLQTGRAAEASHNTHVVWACNSLNRGVTLTFDDGPGENTLQLLDSLKRLDVKATFFVVGGNALQRPDIVLRAFQEGHEIGIHTWNHVNLTQLYEDGNWQALEHEIDDTAQLITNITGTRPRLLRPPYGAAHAGVAKMLGDRNLTMVMWSGGCIDWWLNDMAASLPYLVNGMADAGSLLCLHDSHKSTCDNISLLVELLTLSEPRTTVNPQACDTACTKVLQRLHGVSQQ